MSTAAVRHTTFNDTFSSLRIRNFRLFFIGQGVSQIGNWLTVLAQSLLMLHLTDSGFMVGVLTAVQYGPVLVLGPMAGLLADRIDKRRLLMSVQSVAMLQSAGLAAVAFMDEPSIALIFVLAAVGGVCTALDNPARRSIVVEMVPEELVNNAVSMNSALMTGSRVIGPALAGLLISTVGYAWCFAIDGISYVAVLGAFFLMNSTQFRRPVAAAPGKGQIRAGFRYVRNEPVLLVPLVMAAIIGTFTFNFSVVMPLLVRENLGGSDSTYTLLFSVLSVGSFVAALAMARRAVVPLRHVWLSAAAFGVSMLLLAVSPNLWTAFPVAALIGMASIAFMTSSTTIVQVHADPSMRGRVLALQAMVFLGSTPIGGPILGAIGEWVSPRAGAAVGAIAALAAAAYGASRDPDRRRTDGGATVRPVEPPSGAVA